MVDEAVPVLLLGSEELQSTNVALEWTDVVATNVLTKHMRRLKAFSAEVTNLWEIVLFLQMSNLFINSRDNGTHLIEYL